MRAGIVNGLFENRERKTYIRKGQSRDYDVRITLNKNKDKFIVRFGFLNRGAEILDGKQYLQVSSVEKMPDRIYFRTFDEKKYLDAYKISSSGNATGKYIALLPSEEAEKIYRSRWVGRSFNIKYDEDSGLCYIEQEAN